MFQPLQHKSKTAGFFTKRGRTLFFFGTRHTDLASLPELFPSLEFCLLKQVHGQNIVVADPKTKPEADGHFTAEPNRALVIQTADCLPILASSESMVMGLHAGWRGVAADIIGAGLKLGRFECLAIGPHIKASSFEVGIEVSNKLEGVGPASAILPHPSQEKRYVDLQAIACHQAGRFGCEMFTLPDDTFTSDLFFSYRRGKATPDRQYSFVALVDE